MGSKIRSKKSQVTIFVIIAIFLVISIAAIFILRKPEAGQISPAENPAGYVQGCIRANAEAALEEIIPAGGLLNLNDEGYYMLNGTKIAKVCSTIYYEKLCTNEHPLLRKEIEEQIADAIKPDVEKCFADLAGKLSRYDYRADSGLNLSAEILPGYIIVKARKKISYTRNEQTASLDEFDARLKSALWDFTGIENKIVNQELDCECGMESCNAFPEKLSLLYPKFKVTKPVYSTDGEEVYSIEEIDTGDTFNFAIRNCVPRPYGYAGPL